MLGYRKMLLMYQMSDPSDIVTSWIPTGLCHISKSIGFVCGFSESLAALLQEGKPQIFLFMNFLLSRKFD